MIKVYSSLVLVFACVACGSSFSSGDGGGAGAGQAGDASGGQASSAGSGGDAGELDMGGASSGGDGGSTAGSAGASAGSGGVAVGGSGGTAGSPGGGECAKIKAQYQTALEKARMCDQGSTQQCSPSSTVEALSCGCPVLVNAKSEFATAAKKARQAYQDAKCVEGVACAAIACAPIAAASCAPTLGSTSAFVCTAVTAIQN